MKNFNKNGINPLKDMRMLSSTIFVINIDKIT